MVRILKSSICTIFVFMVISCNQRSKNTSDSLFLLNPNLIKPEKKTKNKSVPVIKDFNISNADFVYVAKEDSSLNNNILASKDGNLKQNFFKITSSGLTEKIIFQDTNKEEIKDLNITHAQVLKMSPDYFLFEIGFVGFYNNIYNNYIQYNFLVNIQNGKVYEYKATNYKSGKGSPIKSIDGNTFFKNKKQLGSFIENDKNGNIYFLEREVSPRYEDSYDGLVRALVKLNIQNPEKGIVRTVLNPPNHNLGYQYKSSLTVGFWSMDNSGNVAYVASETNTNATVYMYKKNGESPKVFNRKPVNFWQGLDGKLYYCQKESSLTSTKTGIYKLNASNGTSTQYGERQVKDYNIDFCDDDDLVGYHGYKEFFKLDKSQRIIASGKVKGHRGVDFFHLFQIYNGKAISETDKVTQIIFKDQNGINKNLNITKFLGSSGNFYYLQDENKRILKINETDDTYTEILKNYIVYKLSVNAKDHIIFHGLDKTDMTTTIMGKLENGNVRILKKNIAKNSITVLKRIK